MRAREFIVRSKLIVVLCSRRVFLHSISGGYSQHVFPFNLLCTMGVCCNAATAVATHMIIAHVEAR